MCQKNRCTFQVLGVIFAKNITECNKFGLLAVVVLYFLL